MEELEPQRAPRARVKVLLLDGNTVSAEGLWQPIGDRAAWEFATGEPWPRLGTPLPAREQLWCVYRILERAGHKLGAFEAWATQVQDVALSAAEPEVDAANPTEPAPPPTT